MFGKTPSINPLASRKQLLIAESELNRAGLVEEWQNLADGVRSLTSKARTIRSFASAAVSLIAGFTSFRRAKSAFAGEKPSWWQTLLKAAQLAGSLWLEFCPRPKS
jgi:hypothetical protein